MDLRAVSLHGEERDHLSGVSSKRALSPSEGATLMN